MSRVLKEDALCPLRELATVSWDQPVNPSIRLWEEGCSLSGQDAARKAGLPLASGLISAGGLCPVPALPMPTEGPQPTHSLAVAQLRLEGGNKSQFPWE